MKYGKKLLIVFVALAVIGSAVRASAPAVVSVGVGDQYYNEGNVATLVSFADMLFKTTPEAIFPQQ